MPFSAAQTAVALNPAPHQTRSRKPCACGSTRNKTGRVRRHRSRIGLGEPFAAQHVEKDFGAAARHVGVGLADDGTPIWQPVPDEYAIGSPRDLRNGAGGVAIALRMQDPDGSRCLAFHQRLLGEVGPNGKSRALSIAKEFGFDPARLEKDMASDEVEATLSENAKLAKVPSRHVLELADASSGDMRLSDHAARSMI
jgi:hypothetical protein